MATLAIVLTAVIWLVDYLTGPQIAFSLFYLAVVAVVAWRTDNMRLAVAMALLAAVAWLSAEWLTQSPHSPLVLAWNVSTRLTIFVIIAVLLVKLKDAIAVEQAMARTDFLTDVLNARAFAELVRAESQKSIRHGRPLAVAYVDLDNFKKINDQWGHSQGDRVLRAVAETMRAHLRGSDIVARLGGDEFAILLPETDDAAVTPALERMRAALLAGMRERGWPVTFSIGAAVFTAPPADVDEIIRIADEMMYRAKTSGKNRLCVTDAEGSVELPSAGAA